MNTTKSIYCCRCKSKVKARLTKGTEIYPHLKDLHKLPFWKCDTCNNYVGCHYKTSNWTRPLGCIPTKDIMKVRSVIHGLLDPLWKTKKISRTQMYKRMSISLGYEYHTANIRSVTEAHEVLAHAKQLVKEIS